MKINPVKAFSDNYIWMFEEDGEVLIVDPGEAEGAIRYIQDNKLNLRGILLTHNHDDHTGGVDDIVEIYPNIPVFGPAETAAFANHIVSDGDAFELMGHDFKVMISAGHTSGHISYLVGDALLCGDALFSGGCGRVFTGDYQAQFDALQRFSQLEDQVKVYGAHEYTQTNLQFAKSVEPTNPVILEAVEQVEDLRSNDLPTLPSTIGREKEINLFLQAGTLEEFIQLRNGRDGF